MTFNDANVTGNYAVFHAKLSKPFRDQFSAERLAEAFKVFRDNKIDFDHHHGQAAGRERAGAGHDNGVLKLYGYFDTAPSRVHYVLEFIVLRGRVEGVRINVQLKPIKYVIDGRWTMESP